MTMKLELFHAVHNITNSTTGCYEQMLPVLPKEPAPHTHLHKLIQVFGTVSYDHEH